MVNSDRGISNLHVSSDTIIDASMPALIQEAAKEGPDGEEADCKCVIPDSGYAAVYAETINFCKEHGAFDPSEMGTVPNVGLMADKAEEYGSHPQTFTAPGAGKNSCRRGVREHASRARRGREGRYLEDVHDQR